jgi:hypothetical protein
MFAMTLSLIAATATAHAGDAEILRTGLFHGDEVSAEVAGSWYGLFEEEEGFALVETRVRVQSVFDPLVDMPGEATGWLVTADSEVDPLLLVRGLPGLAEGPVITVAAGGDDLEVGGSYSLSEGPRGWYALAAFGTAEAPPDLYASPRVSDYELRLYRHPPLALSGPAEAAVSQQLVHFEALMDGRPQLLWAGDLDRDGQLDLLMDATFHYNVSDYTLWTSSGAPEGQLVRQAARFATSGC